MATAWLEAVADTRLGGGGGDGRGEAQSTISVSRDGASKVVVLTCASPASSSAAVAEVLLAEFASGPAGGGPSGRPRPGAALARGIQVEVQQSSSSSGGGGGGPSGTLQVTFKSSEPEAAASLERAARLFEAYLHFHVKTTKSHLHTLMRQRLTLMRQELKSCAHSSFAPAKA